MILSTANYIAINHYPIEYLKNNDNSNNNNNNNNNSNIQ